MNWSYLMSGKHRIQILVADDHSVVRKGIVSLLSLSQHLQVVGEAENGVQAVEMALRLKVDVVLMDIHMPIMGGLEATEKIKSAAPQIKILVLSAFDNSDYVLPVLKCGANGYLLKDGNIEDIEHAIEAVHSGQAFFSPRISQVVLEGYLQQPEAATIPSTVNETPIEYHGPLTNREREILVLITHSKTHQQIGDFLHISVRTVDTHCNNILKKLNVHNTAGLVTYAIRNDLVSLK